MEIRVLWEKVAWVFQNVPWRKLSKNQNKLVKIRKSAKSLKTFWFLIICREAVLLQSAFQTKRRVDSVLQVSVCTLFQLWSPWKISGSRHVDANPILCLRHTMECVRDTFDGMTIFSKTRGEKGWRDLYWSPAQCQPCTCQRPFHSPLFNMTMIFTVPKTSGNSRLTKSLVSFAQLYLKILRTLSLNTWKKTTIPLSTRRIEYASFANLKLKRTKIYLHISCFPLKVGIKVFVIFVPKSLSKFLMVITIPSTKNMSSRIGWVALNADCTWRTEPRQTIWKAMRRKTKSIRCYWNNLPKLSTKWILTGHQCLKF